MSNETQQIDGSSTESADGDVSLGKPVTRRRAIQIGGAALATAATAGSASAQENTNEATDVMIDFSADLAHDPWIPGSITVVEHKSGMGDLGFTNDNGEQVSLNDHGYVLASDRSDSDTPTAVNPITLQAANIQADEFTDFPRGVTDADDDPVSATDAANWALDESGTAGTLTVENADRDSLRVAATGQTSGDVATARFTDFDVTSGIARKFLQVVQNVDVLDGVVEFRVESSAGNTLVARNDAAGDVATEAVLTATTGASQVGQARLGELGSLDDITAIEIAIVDGDGDVTIHGLNVERESAWTFGSQEFVNADDEVETRTVENPSGEFSITSLSTLPSEFSEAVINNKMIDFEIRASELPTAQIWAREKDTPDTYNYAKELDMFVQFEGVTAYDLTNQTFGSLFDVVEFPPGRYRALQAATGFDAVESWEDIEAISWTDRSGEPSTDGEQIEMLSNLSAADVTGWRARIEMSEDRLATLTSTGGGGAAVGVSGSGDGFDYLTTVVFGTVAGLGVLFRSKLMAIVNMFRS